MPPSMQQRRRIREKNKASRERIKARQAAEKGQTAEQLDREVAIYGTNKKDKPSVPERVRQGVTYAAGVPLGSAAGLTAEAGSALLDALGAGKDAVVDKFRDLTKDKVKSEDLPKFDAPPLEPSSNNTADIKEAVSKLPKPQQNMVARVMQESMGGSSASFPGTEGYQTPSISDYGALYEALEPEASSEAIKTDSKADAKTDSKPTTKPKTEEKPKAEPEVEAEAEEDLLFDDEGQFIGDSDSTAEQLTGDEQRDEFILNAIAGEQGFSPEFTEEVERFNDYQQNLDAGLDPEAAAYFADREEAQMMAPENEQQSKEAYEAELKVNDLERLIDQFELAGDDPSSDKNALYWQLEDAFRDIDESDFFAYRPQVTSRGVGRSNFPNIDYSVNPDMDRLRGQTQIGQGPLRLEEGARRLPPGPNAPIQGGTRAGIPPYRISDSGIQNPEFRAYLEAEAARRGGTPLSDQPLRYQPSEVDRLSSRLEMLRNRLYGDRNTAAKREARAERIPAAKYSRLQPAPYVPRAFMGR